MLVEILYLAAVHRPHHVSRSEDRPALHDWSKVAACESSGDWNANTGNGYYGGLQFDESTWDAYHGQGFATRADLATEAQQIVVAERLYRARGSAPWPVCGRYLEDAA